MLVGDAAGEVLVGYAMVLAAISLGPSGFGVLCEGQAFMEPFDALAALGMASVAITVAAARGGCDGTLLGTVWGMRMVAAAVTPVLAVIAALATGRQHLIPLSRDPRPGHARHADHHGFQSALPLRAERAPAYGRTVPRRHDPARDGLICIALTSIDLSAIKLRLSPRRQRARFSCGDGRGGTIQTRCASTAALLQAFSARLARRGFRVRRHLLHARVVFLPSPARARSCSVNMRPPTGSRGRSWRCRERYSPAHCRPTPGWRRWGFFAI